MTELAVIIAEVVASLVGDIMKIVQDASLDEETKKAKILALRPTLQQTNADVQAS